MIFIYLLTDMLEGPEQSLDPPEEYEHLNSFWMERNFIVGGISRVKGCFVTPEAKAMIQEGLRTKRLTWDYLGSMNFFTILTSALLPTFYLPHIIKTMIDEDIKKDATALMWIHIEHWWRVNGLDPASREYNPVVGALLRKYRITLPFTIEGHHNDEFRALTHARGSKPGQCGCYLCLIAEQKTELDRLVWDTMRAGEAKRGRYIVSWDQYNELEAKRLENESRVAKGLSLLPPPSFVENINRPIKVPKPEEIMYCMSMLKIANNEHRPLETDELDDIVNALVVPLNIFTKESLRLAPPSSATSSAGPSSSIATTSTSLKSSSSSSAATAAVISAPITPTATAKKAFSSAKSAHTTTATAATTSHSRRSVARDTEDDVSDDGEGDIGDSGSLSGAAMEAILAQMDIQDTPFGRPKRK